MSWQAVTWVLEHSQSTLGSRLVLLSIASHANREGVESWPAVDTIAIEARLSRRQVQCCLLRLKQSGELNFEENRGGRAKTNHYTLPLVYDWITAQSSHPLGAEKPRTPEQKGRNPRQETVHSSAQEPSLTVQENGKPRAQQPRAPDTALELDQKRKIEKRDRREKLEFGASRVTSVGRAEDAPPGIAVKSSVAERFLQRGKLSASGQAGKGNFR